MVDVLKEEEELEDDAKAVLGASDDQNCTYSRVNMSLNFTFWLWKMAVLAYDAHEVCWMNIPYFSLSSAAILKHNYGFYWKFGDCLLMDLYRQHWSLVLTT